MKKAHRGYVLRRTFPEGIGFSVAIKRTTLVVVHAATDNDNRWFRLEIPMKGNWKIL